MARQQLPAMQVSSSSSSTAPASHRQMFLEQDPNRLGPAINTFGGSLFDALSAEDSSAAGTTRASGAVFISPWSVAQALVMLLNGVKQGSESEKQILFGLDLLDGGGTSALASGSTATVNAALSQLRSEMQQV
jgi:hypothetical protein